MLRLIALIAATCTLLAGPLSGQGLRDQFSELFTFGDCGAALCLGGLSQLAGHGNHFIPATAAGGQAALSFVTNAIATNASNIPIPSSGGGAIFEFVGGLPQRTEISAGPIFAERAETLGRGRLLMGIYTTAIGLNSIRGVPFDNLVFNFGHEDIPPAGLGNPGFENDLIEVRTNLDVHLYVATAFLTYGIVDGVDLGVAVPFVNVSLKGNSTATILPFGSGSSVVHLFEGTSADPVLVAVAQTDGSASGIGDVAGRLKVQLAQSGNVGIGIIGEVRFPTGAEEDLLGSGEFAARGIGVLSARFGDFTPHLNAGYAYRRDTTQTDAILATIGFDQLLAPGATMAVDLVTEWQVGESPLSLGQPIVYDTPVRRTVPVTFIPDRRDDIIGGSVGFKFEPSDRLRILANALVPLGNGGVQPTATWTAGFEVRF